MSFTKEIKRNNIFKTTVFIFITVSASLCSCGDTTHENIAAKPATNKKVEFEIVQTDTFLNGIVYLVYVSANEWQIMASFADSLMQEKGPAGGVDFFDNINNIPKMERGGWDADADLSSHIATYRLDWDDGKYKLYIQKGGVIVLPNGRRFTPEELAPYNE